jgi:hypothetical protein
VTFLIRSWRGEGVRRRDQLILAVSLLFFGVSDLIEVHTGAWWRPWWLFMLKALCLLGIIRSLWKLWPMLGSATPRDRK